MVARNNQAVRLYRWASTRGAPTMVMLLLSIICFSATATTINVIQYAPDNKGSINTIILNVWQQAASNLNLQYKIIKTSDKKTALTDFSQGKGKILIGPFNYNELQGKPFDYINSYISLRGGVIVASNSTITFWQKIRQFFEIVFSRALFGLIIILMIATVLVWWSDKNHPESPFAGSMKRGLLQAFWFQTVTFTTIGYGDTVPVSNRGKFVTTLILYAYLVLLAAFTASITAELTSKQLLSQQLASLFDLHDQKVAYLKNEDIALDDLKRYGAIGISTNSVAELVNQVAEQNVVAGFANRLELRDYLKQNPSAKIMLTHFVIDHGDYLFILKSNDPLTNQLAMTLYQMNLQGQIDTIIDNSVGFNNRELSTS